MKTPASRFAIPSPLSKTPQKIMISETFKLKSLNLNLNRQTYNHLPLAKIEAEPNAFKPELIREE